eukprot:m51a1_g5313 hypothetical protein (268) ;mRNA; r:294670-295745
MEDQQLVALVEAMLDNSGEWETRGMNGSGLLCAKLRGNAECPAEPTTPESRVVAAVARCLEARARPAELLELRHVDLSAAAAPAVAGLCRAALEALPALRTLDLEHCTLGDTGLASLLGAVLERRRQLRFLYLAGNKLTSAGLQRLHDALFEGPEGPCTWLGAQLEGLGLTNNALLSTETTTDDSAAAATAATAAAAAAARLVHIVHGCPALHTVHLNHVGLSERGQAEALLLAAVPAPCKLRRVYLKQNDAFASWPADQCPPWAVL